MVSVTMKTISAGPLGTRHVGDVYQVSDEEGKMLVENHYATYETSSIKIPVSIVDVGETAAITNVVIPHVSPFGKK